MFALLALVSTALSVTDAAGPRPPPPPPPAVPLPPFSFGPAFGSHMVLQQAPAKAAVYGYLGAGATAVKVTVASAGKVLYSVDADIQTTLHQPYGPDWGVQVLQPNTTLHSIHLTRTPIRTLLPLFPECLGIFSLN